MNTLTDIDEIIHSNLIKSFSLNYNFIQNIDQTLLYNYTSNKKFHIIWTFLHSFSFQYPVQATDQEKMILANFIAYQIPNILGGCGSCNQDYKDYLKTVNIFQIVSSRENLSTFFVNLHNHINLKKHSKNNLNISNNFIINNIKIDQPINMAVSEVEEIYSKNDYITLLENKYNINFVNLFNENKLDEFVTKINSLQYTKFTTFNVSINLS